jgi:hypothetical protein
MDPQLKAQLRQTIGVAARSSVDSYGQATFGAASNVAARVEEERRRIERRDGTFVESTHRIYTETAITYESRIWLPGDSTSDATLAREPQQVHSIVDELGTVHHYEVVL